MSGVVEVTLTDKEVARLLAWGDFFGDQGSPLFLRLEGYEHALACRPEVCAPRDLDPNAP